MFYVSGRMTTPPAVFSTPLQERVYSMLEDLCVPFERVETDPGITMEDCRKIDEVIGTRIVKTVFLCNRQQTKFYLYAMPDGKPFVTREFCSALGIPRVSFAPEDKLLELAGTEVGATTVLSACLESASGISIVIDRRILDLETYAGTDGTYNCFLMMKTADLTGKFLPATRHSFAVI